MRGRVRLAALASLGLAALGVAAIALGQEAPRERRVGVRWEEGVPQVRFSALDLANRAARAKLESGLPQTLVLRVYAVDAEGAPLALGARTCRVTFDLWEQAYRVEVQDHLGDRSERHEALDDVLRLCLTAVRLPVGTAADYAEERGREVSFAVHVELNPVSPETVQRLRRWLARPAGGGRVGGDAFIGSFVSLFVNRRIGAAERTIQFHSQDITVPP